MIEIKCCLLVSIPVNIYLLVSHCRESSQQTVQLAEGGKLARTNECVSVYLGLHSCLKSTDKVISYISCCLTSWRKDSSNAIFKYIAAGVCRVLT